MPVSDDSDRKDVIETQISIGVIKAGQVETNRRLSNIEKKMDSLTVVKQEDFVDYKKFVSETYATNDSIKPMKTLFWAIITALVVGIISVGFTLTQTRLK